MNLGLPAANRLYEGFLDLFHSRDTALAIVDAVLPDEFRKHVRIPPYKRPSVDVVDIEHVRRRREWYWTRATALNVLRVERGHRAMRRRSKNTILTADNFSLS